MASFAGTPAKGFNPLDVTASSTPAGLPFIRTNRANNALGSPVPYGTAVAASSSAAPVAAPSAVQQPLPQTPGGYQLSIVGQGTAATPFGASRLNRPAAYTPSSPTGPRHSPQSSVPLPIVAGPPVPPAAPAGPSLYESAKEYTKAGAQVAGGAAVAAALWHGPAIVSGATSAVASGIGSAVGAVASGVGSTVDLVQSLFTNGLSMGVDTTRAVAPYALAAAAVYGAYQGRHYIGSALSGAKSLITGKSKQVPLDKLYAKNANRFHESQVLQLRRQADYNRLRQQDKTEHERVLRAANQEARQIDEENARLLQDAQRAENEYARNEQEEAQRIEDANRAEEYSQLAAANEARRAQVEAEEEARRVESEFRGVVSTNANCELPLLPALPDASDEAQQQSPPLPLPPSTTKPRSTRKKTSTSARKKRSTVKKQKTRSKSTTKKKPSTRKVAPYTRRAFSTSKKRHTNRKSTTRKRY